MRGNRCLALQPEGLLYLLLLLLLLYGCFAYAIASFSSQRYRTGTMMLVEYAEKKN
jgi:hypothetical protein